MKLASGQGSCQMGVSDQNMTRDLGSASGKEPVSASSQFHDPGSQKPQRSGPCVSGSSSGCSGHLSPCALGLNVFLTHPIRGRSRAQLLAGNTGISKSENENWTPLQDWRYIPGGGSRLWLSRAVRKEPPNQGKGWWNGSGDTVPA